MLKITNFVPFEEQTSVKICKTFIYSVTKKKESLSKWLYDMKIIYNDMKRTRTHLCMAVGTCKLMFLEVPNELRKEFLERYYLSDEPKFIVELFGKTFPMAFDIDFIDFTKIEITKLVNMVKIIKKNIDSDVYVTGAISKTDEKKVKSGYHIKFPNKIVTISEALIIRNEIIESLCKVFPDDDWETIIDKFTYYRGLRMFGSRKIINEIDVGRVYSLLFVINETGVNFTPDLTGLDLLKKLSINIRDV
jgi:hypothetical protein